jgi:hypothetical protein
MLVLLPPSEGKAAPAGEGGELLGSSLDAIVTG